MSGASEVPSSCKPSLEMRRSSSCSSLSDTQSGGSIARTVTARVASCHGLNSTNAPLLKAAIAFATAAHAIRSRCHQSSLGKFQNSLRLLARDTREPFEKLVDRRAGFEVLEK